MKTLVVMSGGGMPGLSIYAGILRALYMRGIVADEVHGTSAGAIAGALWLANNFDGLHAANILLALDDDDVRDPLVMWRTRHRWLNHFMAGEKIRRIVERELPAKVSELPARFSAYMVQDGSGEVYQSRSSDCLWDVVRASSSIRGVFPPVNVNGHLYSDGGTKANVPLPLYWSQFDQVFVCIATQPVNYKFRRGIISNLFYSIHELMEGQVDRVMDEVRPQLGTKVCVIRPPVTGGTSTLRFNHDLVIPAQIHAMECLNRFYENQGGNR